MKVEVPVDGRGQADVQIGHSEGVKSLADLMGHLDERNKLIDTTEYGLSIDAKCP